LVQPRDVVGFNPTRTETITYLFLVSGMRVRKAFVCKCGSPTLKGRAVCSSCYNLKKRERYAKDSAFREKVLKEQSLRYNPQESKGRYHHYRRLAFEVLGGYRCAQCGFDDPRALQIDHVDNGGYACRKNGELGRRLYRKVVREKGVGFQVLCANCNWIKKAEFEGRSLEYYWLNQSGPIPKRHPRATTAQPKDTFEFFSGDASMSLIAERFHMSRHTLRDWWVAEFGENEVMIRCRRVQAQAASATGKSNKHNVSLF
jgi:hypothetical protein